jgi:hypothetical protein
MELQKIEPAGPPMPAVTRILSNYSRDQVESFVEIAVAMLDTLDGDPDFEGQCDEDEISRCDDMGRPVRGNGPGCDIGDPGDKAYLEWHTMRGSQKGGPNIAKQHEDDEEDNEDRSLDESEPCFVSLRDLESGAGCPIADPGGCEHDGREPGEDEEREQMAGDVPMLRTYSLEHNVFTDERVSLGISNLMSSFVVGGDGVRSADSGAVHKGRGVTLRSRPGQPV